MPYRRVRVRALPCWQMEDEGTGPGDDLTLEVGTVECISIRGGNLRVDVWPGWRLTEPRCDYKMTALLFDNSGGKNDVMGTSRSRPTDLEAVYV